MLIETQLPGHHFLVVELKLNVAARGDVDLCLKGLHVLGISPVKKTLLSLGQAVESFKGFKSRMLVQYLTMPAAFPLALAWA